MWEQNQVYFILHKYNKVPILFCLETLISTNKDYVYKLFI